MRLPHLPTILFTFLFFQPKIFSQPFTLVRDINLGTGYEPDRPSDLVESGGSLFFQIKSGALGGVWKSDGAAAGTVMVKAGVCN